MHCSQGTCSFISGFVDQALVSVSALLHPYYLHPYVPPPPPPLAQFLVRIFCLPFLYFGLELFGVRSAFKAK